MKHTIMRNIFICLLLVGFALKGAAGAEHPGLEKKLAADAELACEAFAACDRYLEGWCSKIDPSTGLLPQNLLNPDGNRWTAWNSAADNFPFMVIAARFTRLGFAEPLFRKAMIGEKKLTIGAFGLPVAYDLARGVRLDESLDRTIFGASEYAKDGLMPMLEILGPGAWSERMEELVQGIFEAATVETPYGRLPSVDTEVNGEMLQVLTRLYWMTGSERYLEWARRIGDAYCYEVLQRHHGLPAHIWDFRKHTGDGRFKARDHGCEIVSGLTLLYTVEKEKDSSRAVSYFQAIANMLERIQEIAADSSSGLMYNEVDVATGELTREGFSDNWGYNYYAYYTFYMATGEEKYRDSALRVLENIHRLRDYNWERRTVNDTVAYGADGYADAIEGALGLLSHLRVESAFDWVETETRRMLSWQREDGIIEGWHGDGNFARTALMYAFYKTKGCYAAPWREDIELAAEETENGLEVYLRAKEAWQGRLFFDPPRHRHYLRMKKDYPRINAFPEWFTVEPLGLYRVRIRGGEGDTVLGDCLIKGYPLELKAGETVRLSIGPG